MLNNTFVAVDLPSVVDTSDAENKKNNNMITSTYQLNDKTPLPSTSSMTWTQLSIDEITDTL